MRTNGFGRALRYFIRQAELYILCVIGGSFALSAYIWLLNGDAFRDMLVSVPGAVVFISMILLFISSMSASQYWYSIPISFGCIRKNAFLGNLVMDLLFMAESLVFYMTALKIFHPDDLFSVSVTIILPFYLALEGISKFLGIAIMKWGKAAYIFMLIAIVIFSIICGMLVGFSGAARESIQFDLIQSMYKPAWKLAGFAAGTAVCIAGNAAGYRILRQFEVKA